MVVAAAVVEVDDNIVGKTIVITGSLIRGFTAVVRQKIFVRSRYPALLVVFAPHSQRTISYYILMF